MSACFYHQVIVEFIFEFFVDQSIVLYGGNIVNLLMSTLSEQSQVMDRLKQHFLPDEISDEDAVSDFLRKLMEHAKNNPSIGHRQQVTTLCKNQKTESDIKTEDEENREDHKEMSIIMDSLEVAVDNDK
eukprot:4855842-Ditylum_brightwellii.AAC.1